MKNELAMATAAIVVALCVPAYSADSQAGKTAAQAKCVQCHAAHDWEGEDAASLESLIHDIVAGTVKHKVRLELSPAEIANIAAYWGGGGKSR